MPASPGRRSRQIRLFNRMNNLKNLNGGSGPPVQIIIYLSFIVGSKLEIPRSKADGVLTAASASLPEIRKYSENKIYAYGKSPSHRPENLPNFSKQRVSAFLHHVVGFGKMDIDVFFLHQQLEQMEVDEVEDERQMAQAFEAQIRPRRGQIEGEPVANQLEREIG
ncbi:hypothetical protein B0H12DRAFT_1082703 [Mycena haematopus]|nr:hypothetical protein B0H12DRAFT_1082703 [Mycena haematopus]